MERLIPYLLLLNILVFIFFLIRSVKHKVYDIDLKVLTERLTKIDVNLTEIRNLASGVGDLKNILTNVKTRGMWGEAQLEALLSDTLNETQFSKFVQIKKNSKELVDFTLNIPTGERATFIPIDSKFPLDSYTAYINAFESGDKSLTNKKYKLLEQRIRSEAKSISSKYINPPITTDYALMFLPLEGLYSILISNTKLMDYLYNDCRIILAGPNSLMALINSIKIGLKSTTITRKSHELIEIFYEIKKSMLQYGNHVSLLKDNLSKSLALIEKTENISCKMIKNLDNLDDLKFLE